MAYKRIYIIGIIALFMGFGIGWILKPSNDVHIHQETTKINKEQENEIWTCSMHPQIQQPEFGLCALCGMDLIVLEKTSSNNDPLVLEMTKNAVKLANIQTVVVGGVDVNEKTFRLNGKVKMDERRYLSQTAHIPGRIEELFIKFTGEKVMKGQKIASLYAPKLISAQQELIQAKAYEDENPALLKAARRKLHHWKVPNSEIDEIEHTGVVKKEFNIYADASGIVTKRYIGMGDHVMEGEVMLDIIDLNKLWVVFDAYEDDISSIKVGNKITFETASYPDKTFSAKVSYIDPLIDPTTRTIAIRTEINNKLGLLKPEMFVKGILKSKLSGSNDRISIPKSAVMWTGKRSVVYVKIKDRKIPSFKYRAIVLGKSIGDSYIIESGLEPNEEVVVNGNFAIDAAAQLNNQSSMMNSNVGTKGEIEQVESLPDYSGAISNEFALGFNDVINEYLILKANFVKSIMDQSVISNYIRKLENMNSNTLDGDAKNYFMTMKESLLIHANKMNQEESIESQRAEFLHLSQLMIKGVKVFNSFEEKMFVQFCPMAFDNKGGEWLSKVRGIKNPYYGDAMLRCGIVKDTID